MATQKSTQPAPMGVVESLLGEITTDAYFTETLFFRIESPEENKDDEIHALRQVIARMGWKADLALHQMNSVNCMREGRAEVWLLDRCSFRALDAEVQS
ncbi:MAG: hypothetical protein ACRYGA_07835 [Janthinobacterium lividum]